MKKKITFRGMDHSPVVEEYVNKHLEKIEKFLKNMSPVTLDVILEAARVHHHHRVEIRLKAPSIDLVSHNEAPELYLAIDKAIDKMAKEVARDKDKKVSNKRRSKEGFGFSKN